MTKRVFTVLLTALFLLTAFSALSIRIDAQPKKAKKLMSDGDKYLKQKNYQSTNTPKRSCSRRIMPTRITGKVSLTTT